MKNTVELNATTSEFEGFSSKLFIIGNSAFTSRFSWLFEKYILKLPVQSEPGIGIGELHWTLLTAGAEYSILKVGSSELLFQVEIVSFTSIFQTKE